MRKGKSASVPAAVATMDAVKRLFRQEVGLVMPFEVLKSYGE